MNKSGFKIDAGFINMKLTNFKVSSFIYIYMCALNIYFQIDTFLIAEILP